jgi:hypothetical protein
MIDSPCVGYPCSFHVLDVLEHELDGIYGCLTRDEDHWNVSEHCQRVYDIILCAPHGVLVWQFARSAIQLGLPDHADSVCATYQTSALVAAVL